MQCKIRVTQISITFSILLLRALSLDNQNQSGIIIAISPSSQWLRISIMHFNQKLMLCLNFWNASQISN
jgi:hypothetical protein